jgi:hypothetical protein
MKIFISSIIWAKVFVMTTFDDVCLTYLQLFSCFLPPLKKKLVLPPLKIQPSLSPFKKNSNPLLSKNSNPSFYSSQKFRFQPPCHYPALLSPT